MTGLPPLFVHGYAACGVELLPPHRTVAPGAPNPRRARLPGVAVAMAQRLLGAGPTPPLLHVLIGTALGCTTETEQFLVHLIEADEATPRPRAFSQSVHCAIAAQVAIECGARGEAQTFTHGEVSFGLAVLAAQALCQRDAAGLLLLGALDEADSLIARGIHPTLPPNATAGGGMLLCAGPDGAIAELAFLGAGRRPGDPGFAGQLAAAGATHVLRIDPEQTTAGPADAPAPLAALPPPMPARAATATALALAVVSGELHPSRLGLAARPAALAVVASTRFLDWNAVLVRSRP